jgi:hypothetical protein
MVLLSFNNNSILCFLFSTTVANDFEEPPRGATKSDNEISNFQRESMQKCYIHTPQKMCLIFKLKSST